jgi:hypothetical protein
LAGTASGIARQLFVVVVPALDLQMHSVAEAATPLSTGIPHHQKQVRFQPQFFAY